LSTIFDAGLNSLCHSKLSQNKDQVDALNYDINKTFPTQNNCLQREAMQDFILILPFSKSGIESTCSKLSLSIYITF